MTLICLTFHVASSSNRPISADGNKNRVQGYSNGINTNFLLLFFDSIIFTARICYVMVYAHLFTMEMQFFESNQSCKKSFFATFLIAGCNCRIFIVCILGKINSSQLNSIDSADLKISYVHEVIILYIISIIKLDSQIT